MGVEVDIFHVLYLDAAVLPLYQTNSVPEVGEEEARYEVGLAVVRPELGLPDMVQVEVMALGWDQSIRGWSCRRCRKLNSLRMDLLELLRHS